MDESKKLIDENDWSNITQQMSDYDEKREIMIKQCRDMQKLAKHAIFSLHRKDNEQAKEQLTKFEDVATPLASMLEEYPSLRSGSYANAIEEYCEAVALRVYLEEGRLVTRSEIPLAEVEEFVGGVLDFSGELGRHAVILATHRDEKGVRRCRDLCDALLGKCLLVNFRNGALRKKYDSLKYTIRKMENLLYEHSLAEAMGFKKELATSGEVDMPVEDVPSAGGP